MDNYPLISVVILNWNRLEDTKRAINSVLKQTYKNLEIIVIDNASTEVNTNCLIELYPQVKYIQLEKNYGCPGGRNIAIDFCNGEFIFYVDNDGVLDKEAIQNAYNLFQENENIGVVAGKVSFFKSIDEIIENPIIFGEKHFTSVFSGGVTMHKKDIYKKIGLFNADYMYGCEEMNFSLRLLTMNKFVIYSDNVILWHKASPLARNNSFNFVSKYTNKLLTYWELLPTPLSIIFTFWYLLIYPIKCYKSRCLTLFLSNAPKSLKRAIKAKTNSKIQLTFKEYRMFKKLEKNKFQKLESIL